VRGRIIALLFLIFVLLNWRLPILSGRHPGTPSSNHRSEFLPCAPQMERGTRRSQRQRRCLTSESSGGRLTDDFRFGTQLALDVNNRYLIRIAIWAVTSVAL
jgi:hypothetical protein